MVLIGEDVLADRPPDRPDDDGGPDILDIRILLRLRAGVFRHALIAPLDAPFLIDDQDALRQVLDGVIHHLVEVAHDVAAVALKAPRAVVAALLREEGEAEPDDEGDRGDEMIVARQDADEHQYDEQMYRKIDPCREIPRHCFTSFLLCATTLAVATPRSGCSVRSGRLLAEAASIIEQHIEKACEGQDLHEDAAEQHKGVEADAHDLAHAEAVHGIAHEREALDDTGAHRHHVEVEGRLIERLYLTRAAPVDADECKAEQVQEELRQAPLRKGRQLRHGLAEATQDAAADDVGDGCVEQAHDTDDERQEQVQVGQRLLDLRAARIDGGLVEAHLLVDGKRLVKALLHDIHLHVERIDRSQEEQQAERQQLAGNRRDERRAEGLRAGPAVPEGIAEHETGRAEGQDHAQ